MANLTLNQVMQVIALVLTLILLIPAYRRSRTIKFAPSVRFVIIWVMLAALLMLADRWFETHFK